MKKWKTRFYCYIVVVVILGYFLMKTANFSVESSSYIYIGTIFLTGVITVTYLLCKKLAKSVANQAETVQSAVLHTYIGTTKALVAALDERADGCSQADRVVHLTMLISERMVLDESYYRALAWGALLHDIGKIGIPEIILRKPDSLDAKEWAIIRQHSEIGYRMVQPIQDTSEFPDIILYHHEHYDGTGYPLGLAGLDIPIQARVVALADAVAAMASPRPYRSPLSIQNIYAEVRRCSGTQFCPEAANAFLSLDPAEVSHILNKSFTASSERTYEWQRQMQEKIS